MSSSKQHEYRRSKSARTVSQSGCTHFIVVRALNVNATCSVYHTEYCVPREDWDSIVEHETQWRSVRWRRPMGWHIFQAFFCQVVNNDWALVQRLTLKMSDSMWFCHPVINLACQPIFFQLPSPSTHLQRKSFNAPCATTSCLSHHIDR